MDENIKIVKGEIEQLLLKIGVNATVEVSAQDDSFSALLDAQDDNALLIGKHGNTLSSLELIVTLIVSQKLGEFKRVTIEVGSYRAEREQYLSDLADKLKQEVIDSGYEKEVRGLKPWERRFVHLHLQDDDEVMTESVGEDRERTLVIKKK